MDYDALYVRISALERSSEELQAVLLLAERALKHYEARETENGLLTLIKEVRQEAWLVRRNVTVQAAENVDGSLHTISSPTFH